MKKKAIILIVLLSIGMASALLVSYLSSKAEVDIDVTSPISNVLEGDSTFSILGGESVAFNVTTTNLASVPITGVLSNKFTNSLGMNCSDFSALSVETFIGNVSSGVTDLLINCSVVDNNTIDVIVGIQPKTWLVGEVERNVYSGSFQLNAIGTYVFTSQVLV